MLGGTISESDKPDVEASSTNEEGAAVTRTGAGGLTPPPAEKAGSQGTAPQEIKPEEKTPAPEKSAQPGKRRATRGKTKVQPKITISHSKPKKLRAKTQNGDPKQPTTPADAPNSTASPAILDSGTKPEPAPAGDKGAAKVEGKAEEKAKAGAPQPKQTPKEASPSKPKDSPKQASAQAKPVEKDQKDAETLVQRLVPDPAERPGAARSTEATGEKKAPPKRRLRWLVTVLVAIAIVGGVVTWTKIQPPTTDPQQTAGAEAEAIKQIEELLSQLSIDAGLVDGIADAQTRTAISEFQVMLGLPVDGEPSDALLIELRAVSDLMEGGN